MPHRGKEGSGFMEGVVYASLGRRSGRVVVGPGRGLDNAVVAVGGRNVMLFTVDPVSAIPAFGMELSAWLSTHLIASDFTSSGVDPQFAAFAYNFPPSMASAQRKAYVRSVGGECSRLGIAIVAGHTGTYPGGGFTVIGSGAMFGTCPSDGYVTPSMAREGDAILMTKHAAIEATCTLARSFPMYLAKRLGRDLVDRAGKMTSLCTTVGDARAARGGGLGRDGVTSMHDATEGGVLGALDEMAFASGRGFRVDEARIPVSDEAKEVCGAFGIDPLRTMGEGALLVTCAPSAVRRVSKALSRAGIGLTEIGKVERDGGLMLGRARRKASAWGRDGYWRAYDRAVRRGLR